MSLVHLEWHPTDRQLRQFSVACAVALPGLAWWFSAHLYVVCALGFAGAVCLAAGVLRPQSLRWLFIGLSIVALPIGLVVSEAVILFAYFVVLTPMGLLLRSIRGDGPVHRRFDRSRGSYWEARRRDKLASTYYRQS